MLKTIPKRSEAIAEMRRKIKERKKSKRQAIREEYFSYRDSDLHKSPHPTKDDGTPYKDWSTVRTNFHGMKRPQDQERLEANNMRRELNMYLPFKPVYNANKFRYESYQGKFAENVKLLENLRQMPKSTAPADEAYRDRCAGRVRDLTEFCQAEYNLDPAHTRLLASALIPCMPHLPVWLICETNKSPFWDHFNDAVLKLGLPKIWNIAGTRNMRPKYSIYQARDWLATRHTHPRIITDTVWKTPFAWKGLSARHAYWDIVQECVKARIHVPLTHIPPAGVADELYRLLLLVVDPTHRRVMPDPAEPTPALLEYLRVLPDVNMELTAPVSLMANITLLSSAHAAMYGRTSLEDIDHQTGYLALKGCVRKWTTDIFHAYWRNERGLASFTGNDLMCNTGYDRWVIYREMGRLINDGLIERKYLRGTGHQIHTYKLTPNGMIAMRMLSGVGCEWW